MKALSIRQPWLHAIFHLGKRIENRDWANCSYRGPVLLHASKGCTRDEYDNAVDSIHTMRADIGARRANVPPLADLPRGVILGIARIVRADRHPSEGVVQVRGIDGATRSLDWGRGYLGYRIASEGEDQPTIGLQLEDVQRLVPVPYKGALGFFNVMGSELPEVYQAAWRALGGAA